nr:myosin-J heavy chain-like [Nothobranchius furzeri]
MERMYSTSYVTQEELTPFHGTSSGKTFFTDERDTAAQYHRDREMNPVVKMRAFLAEELEISRVQLRDSLEKAGKLKSENNRLEVQKNELKLCVQQSKEEMEIMEKRFNDLKKTLDEFDECVSQVNAERNQKFLAVYRTPSTVNELTDKTNTIMAIANTKLDCILETFLCNLRQQLSATIQVNAGQACSFKEPTHHPKSDVFQVNSGCISALQNTVKDTEYKISRFHEQLKLYTQEIEQLPRRAGHQDRDPSILLNQVEKLQIELESAKNKAWGAENELKHARAYAGERDQMAKKVEIKLSHYENEIFHLQSAFKDFRKWTTLTRAKNGETDALASVIDQLEMRIMNLTEVREEMATAYPPKPYKTVPELSQLQLDFIELSKKYTEAEREIQQLKNIMRDSPSEEECSSYKETIQELRNEVSQLKDERSRCNKKIASLHRNIERVEREKISVERDCGELESKNQELLVLVNALNENCESQKEELKSVRGSQTTVEHEEMKHKAQELELLVNSLNEQFEKLKEFHKKSEFKQQQEIKQLSDELEKAQSAERVYRTKLTQATAEVEEMKNTNQHLNVLVNSLNDQFEKLKEFHKQSEFKQQQEIKRLSDELEKAQSASRVYRTKLTQAIADLEEMREKHERTLAVKKMCFVGTDDEVSEEMHSSSSELEQENSEHLRLTDADEKGDLSWSDSDFEFTSSEGEMGKELLPSSSDYEQEESFADQTSPKETKCLETPGKRRGEVKKMDRSPKSAKKEQAFGKRSSKHQLVKLERDGSEKPHSSTSRPQPKPTESAPQPVRGEPIEQRTVPHKALPSFSGKTVLPPLSGKTVLPPLSGKSLLPSLSRKPLLPSLSRKPLLPSIPTRPTPPF